ncbi:MAG: GtrA family protein [Lachnospiraceae bacterium]|nr:GtrA family protein [Lachnospiraceae bacterium]
MNNIIKLKDLLISLFMKYREVIMYLIMGVATTVVSWASYAFFTKAFSPDSGFVVLFSKLTHGDTSIALIAIANVLSWILAILFAYITNKLWVFNSKSWKPSLVIAEFTKFVGARILTGFLEWFGVPFLAKIGLDQKPLGIEGGLSKIVVSVLVVLLNYVFSKLFIFKNDKK